MMMQINSVDGDANEFNFLLLIHRVQSTNKSQLMWINFCLWGVFHGLGWTRKAIESNTKPSNDARQPMSGDVINHRFPVPHMVYFTV